MFPKSSFILVPKVSVSKSVPKISDENKEFLKKRGLTLTKVGEFFGLSQPNIIGSTGKNRFVDALRAYDAFLKENEELEPFP